MAVRVIHMRQLTGWDVFVCWRLAHDPAVFRSSHAGRPPTMLEHMKWMWKWGRPSADRVAMAVMVQTPVGWRFAGRVNAEKRAGGGCTISVALRGYVRGRGLGSIVLSAAAPAFAAMLGGPVVAEIRRTNRASIRAFTNAGFRHGDVDMNGKASYCIAMIWDGAQTTASQGGLELGPSLQ